MKQVIMDKGFRFYRFVFVFGLTLFLNGCVGLTPRVQEAPLNPEVKSSEKSADMKLPQDESIIFEDSREYRYYETPFGVVKKRVDLMEKQIRQPGEKTEVRVAEITKTSPPVKMLKAKKNFPKPVTRNHQKKEPDETPKVSGPVVLNFDDADLYEVIRTMAELLGINYIVDPSVRGNVTIHTTGKLKETDLFPVFYQILEANGFTAVKEGSLYKIVKLKEAARLPILSKMGRDPQEVAPSQRVVIQIIPLEHIAAGEMTKLLTPFISAEGSIISHDQSNTLVLVDKGINVLKALRLVETFDIDTFEMVDHRFYPLKNTEAEEMAKLLNDILSTYGSGIKDEFKIIGVNRMNTLLVISRNPKIFEKIDHFITRLDVVSESAEPQIYVYSVKNGEALELAGLLNNIFSKSGAPKVTIAAEKPKEEKEARPYAPPDIFAKKEKKKTQRALSMAAGEFQGSGTLRGEIRITADEIRNALIIEATAYDYQVIHNILKRLDVLPRQVLIEVTIAEISLDESTDLGVEWDFVKNLNLDTGLLTANISANGLSYVIGLTEEWAHALSVLAQENKVNILSSPTVLASDNKEANINIADQLPVVSAIYDIEAGENGVVQTNIQYRDTGVILSVTPHINENGLVSMDIRQEVSDEGLGRLVAGKMYPSFKERSVSTTLTVKHAQTIVIGGLIKESTDHNKSGVPGLNRLPILGYLFGSRSKSFIKTELIILITPHVIVSLDDVDEVTREFKSKVRNALKTFGYEAYRKRF